MNAGTVLKPCSPEILKAQKSSRQPTYDNLPIQEPLSPYLESCRLLISATSESPPRGDGEMRVCSGQRFMLLLLATLRGFLPYLLIQPTTK
jgi:hypothetical protein